MLGRELVRQASGAFVPVCIGRRCPTVGVDVEYIEVDLSTPGFANSLPTTIDAVIHLAQSDNYESLPGGASNLFQINVASTAALLEWATVAGASHFILASSGGLYGPGPRAMKETDAVKISGRLTYYYSTKYAAEIIANAYRDQFVVISLRYFFIYGAKQKPTMLIPRMIDAISAGRTFSLAGEFGMRLNPIEVGDAAAATLSALALGASSTINVAGPEVVSMRELGQAIGSMIGKPFLVEHVSADEAVDLVGDISMMSSCLGPPRVGIEAGIERLMRGAIKA